MSILRTKGLSSVLKAPLKGAEKGIGVKCPKCQSSIVFASLQGDAPIRCENCYYPMICRSDLFLIIDACKHIDSPAQGKYAVSVLRQLSEMMPEAGTALGLLPTTLPFALAMGDDERWNILEKAYAAGDDNAREGLELMIKSSPALYSTGFCSKCGAKKYFARRAKSSCPYCQSAD